MALAGQRETSRFPGTNISFSNSRIARVARQNSELDGHARAPQQVPNINAAQRPILAAFHWLLPYKFCAGASGEPVTTGLSNNMVGDRDDVDNDADAPNMTSFRVFWGVATVIDTECSGITYRKPTLKMPNRARLLDLSHREEISTFYVLHGRRIHQWFTTQTFGLYLALQFWPRICPAHPGEPWQHGIYIRCYPEQKRPYLVGCHGTLDSTGGASSPTLKRQPGRKR